MSAPPINNNNNNNTANLPKMCNYTYHHDPFCGHIASFNVETCAAFTCALRNAGDGNPISCPKPVHSHDLISPYSPSLCYQCEREWIDDVKTKAKEVKDNSAEADKTDFLSLEGMNFPPTVHMAIGSPKDHPREHGSLSEQDKDNIFPDPGTQPNVYGLGTHLNNTARAGGYGRRASIDSVDPVGQEIANTLFDEFTQVNLVDVPSYAHAPYDEDNTTESELDLNEFEYLDLSPVSSLQEEPADIYDFGLEDGQVSPRTKELNELHEITSNVTPSFRQVRDSFIRTFPPLFDFSSPMRRHWRD